MTTFDSCHGTLNKAGSPRASRLLLTASSSASFSGVCHRTPRSNDFHVVAYIISPRNASYRTRRNAHGRQSDRFDALRSYVTATHYKSISTKTLKAKQINGAEQSISFRAYKTKQREKFGQYCDHRTTTI